MIKHIVMWKLKEMEETQKIAAMEKIKKNLEDLNGQIEGVVSIEVGIDFLQSDASYDVVLYSVLKSKEALENYQAHPLHVKVATETIKPLIKSRIVVDYKI